MLFKERLIRGKTTPFAFIFGYKHSKWTDCPCLHCHADLKNSQQFPDIDYNVIPCRKIIENIHKL